MCPETVLLEVNSRLSRLDGLREQLVLDIETKDRVAALEQEAEDKSIRTGLMPVYNYGMAAALARQVTIALVLNADTLLLNRSKDLIQLRDEKGQLVGEWVNPETREKMQGKKNVSFISPDFVMYQDVEIAGDPHFVMAEIDFPYLEGIDSIRNVTSGSPSVEADAFLREKMGYTGEGYLSHVIGFNPVVR